MGSRRTATASAAAVLALCAAAAGCSAQADTAPDAAPASPSSGRASAGGAGRLPIEDYLISPRQYGRIEAAESVLVSRCLRRFGLSYDLPVSDYSQAGGQTDRRYGPADADQARRFGYHPPRSAGADASPSPAPIGPDVRKVLGYGADAPSRAGLPTVPAGATYHGKPIPPGGCMAEADAALTSGGGILTDDQVAVDINVDDYTRSMSDPAVRAAFAKWASCMKEQGFTYGSPQDADNDPRWRSGKPSAAEIATAVADVGCKARHGVVKAWLAAEASHEAEDIRAHQAHLTQVRASIRTTLAHAAAVRPASS
jgi:hypothetical protein